MATWYYYNESGDKIEVTGGQLKGLAKAGMITPNTIVETEEGKQAPARKIKGLTFVESAQSEIPPLIADIPLESVNSDAFQAAMDAAIDNSTPSAPPPASNTSPGYIPQKTSDDDVIARSPSGRLVVESDPTVYIPEDATSEWQNFFHITFDGKNIRPTRGVFNVNGHIITVQFFSTDNNVVDFSLKNSDGTIATTFKQPGSVVCSITVGNETVQKRVNVVEIPVKMFVQAKDTRTVLQKIQESQQQANQGVHVAPQIQIVGGNTISEVISQLGFPDTIESVDISHPDIIGQDCVIYQPEIKDGLVYAQHFHYDSRYPGLVVFFAKGRAKIISLKARTLSVDSTGNRSTCALGHIYRAKPQKPVSCLPFFVGMFCLMGIVLLSILFMESPIVATLAILAILGMAVFSWIYRQKLLPLLPNSIRTKLEEKLGKKLDK